MLPEMVIQFVSPSTQFSLAALGSVSCEPLVACGSVLPAAVVVASIPEEDALGSGQPSKREKESNESKRRKSLCSLAVNPGP